MATFIDPDRPDPRVIAELVKQYEATARRLRDQIISPPGASDGAREWNHARASVLLGQVDHEIARLKKVTTKWAGSALSRSMERGAAVADRQAEQAGVRPINDPVSGSFHLVDRGAAEVLARDTVRDLHQAAQSMRDQAQTALRRMAATGVTNAQVNAILTGGVVEGQPVRAIRELREALKKVHGKTVTIMDRNGQPMEFKTGYYAKMVAVTKTRQAVVTARHKRLADSGMDLVVIIGKRSGNFCSAYLDKVFSISGKSEKYPPLSSLPGGGPPFHPNCSKGTAPFIEALADPAAIDAGIPDPATDRMLNNNDRTALQRQFEGSGMARDVHQRTKKLRTDAGRRVATHAGDNPGYQEHVLKDFGIKDVLLNGHSDVGAHIVRGVQQTISSGATLPKSIVVSDQLKAFADPATGRVDPNKIGVYIPESDGVAFNPAWKGWRDPKVAKDRFDAGLFSSADPRHAVFHEMSHQHLIKRGAGHGNALFQSSDDLETALKVSIRAAKNMDEFMAEFRAARMAGRRFDKDVMNLYERLGGR